MRNRHALTLILFAVLTIVLLPGCTSKSAEPEAAPPAEAEQESAPDQEAAPDQPADEPPPTEAPSPTPEPIAEPTAEPTAAPAPVVLYEDDFSDPASGWESYNEFDGILDYQDASYRMQVNAVNTFWVNASQNFDNAAVETEVSQIGGPTDGYFGVAARLSDTYQYYAFLVSGDGRYAIALAGPGQFDILGSGSFESAGAVNAGGEINHLRGVCDGTTLTLIVNGETLLTVEDATLSSGDVGLVAGSASEPGTDALFDYIRVTGP